MTGDSERLLYSYRQAQDALGEISHTQLWRLINAGELERVRIGARAFITARSIAAYVDRLTAAAASA